MVEKLNLCKWSVGALVAINITNFLFPKGIILIPVSIILILNSGLFKSWAMNLSNTHVLLLSNLDGNFPTP